MPRSMCRGIADLVIAEFCDLNFITEKSCADRYFMILQKFALLKLNYNNAPQKFHVNVIKQV